MASISLAGTPLSLPSSLCTNHHHSPPAPPLASPVISLRRRHHSLLASASPYRRPATPALFSGNNSAPLPRNGTRYKVGDFMTRKQDLHVLKTNTSVDEALETLVRYKVTGFPVIDDDWNLVGVISDYDLLALDSISGGSQCDTTLFPSVESSWKTFNEIQKLLMKTYGKVVGDLMTPNPLVVEEATSLEDAARLLIETRYHRLPVVDNGGKLVGIITRGDVIRAALHIKHASERP